jgi:hypothetical protein
MSTYFQLKCTQNEMETTVNGETDMEIMQQFR